MTTLRISLNPDYQIFLESKYGSSGSIQYPTDAGIDLYLPEDIDIEPFETKFINLGIRCEYQSDEGIYYGYQLYSRSSISKTKIRLANSVGIIDPNYRGYLIAAVDNISDKKITLKQGERYFQLVFIKMEKPTKIEIVKKLSETDRDFNGLGSTGK
jgi:dUTP pyrophosphatase